MEAMQKQDLPVNIYDLKYPCLVSPIPPDSTRILHIPGEFEYSGLDTVISFVLECYKTKNKIYVYDAIPINLWRKKVCRIPYEKRIKYVRTVVTSQIADFTKVCDLPAELIDNPIELSDYCDNMLTQGITTARIMDVDGYYVFGKCNKAEYLEMEL